MTIQNQTIRNVSVASAGATVFSYGFKVLAQSDLQVQVNGVDKLVGADFTLSGVGDEGGGNITFVTPMQGGEVVVRRRRMAISRLNDLNPDALTSAALNNDQDAPIMLLQQLADDVGRALKLPLSATGAVDLRTLMPLAPLVVSSDGQGVESGSTALTGDMLLRSNLADANTSGHGGALVAFKQRGTDTAARDIQAKAQERISIRDYGAKADGITNDRDAFQAAIDDALATGSRNVEIHLGNGDINIVGSLNIDANLVGGGDLNLTISGGGKGTRLFHASDAPLFNFSGPAGLFMAKDFVVYSTSVKTAASNAVFSFAGGNGGSIFQNISYLSGGEGLAGACFYYCAPSAIVDNVQFVNCFVAYKLIGYQIGQGSSVHFVGGRVIGDYTPTNTSSVSTGLLLCGNNGGIWAWAVDFIQNKFGVRVTQQNGTSNRELFFVQCAFDYGFTGLSIEDANSYTNVQGCWAASCDNACIAFSAGGDSAVLNINGGTVFNAGASGAAGMQSGIVMTNKGRMHISGVTFRENNHAAVYITNAESGVYSSIQDCQFYDNGSPRTGSAQVLLAGRIIFKNNYINNSAYGVPGVLPDPGSQSMMRIQNNEGFGGVNAVTPPATPPSQVAVVNNTGMCANVYISGGSVNSIALNGANLLTYSPNQPANNMIHLRQGDSLKMVYASTAPNLIWQFL